MNDNTNTLNETTMNNVLIDTAPVSGGREALAHYGEMIREGRPTAEIEDFVRQFPDSPGHGVSRRWLIGHSVWSMLFFGRDDIQALMGCRHYLNKVVYTQAINREKERKAAATGDWGRLLRHPDRKSAWQPFENIVVSKAQLQIDSLFLEGVPLPAILRVCVGLGKADRAAVFANSPWIFQFFAPQFLNRCEPDKLRFLRRRLNEMPIQVTAACLGMIMSEDGGARDDIRELFRSALLDSQSLFSEAVLNYAQDLRTLRAIAATIGDAIWYFRLAHFVPSFDWVMNEAPEDYERLDDYVVIPSRYGGCDNATWDQIVSMHRKFRCNVRDISSDILRHGDSSSLASLTNFPGGKKTRGMLLRYALLAVIFFPRQSACAVLRGIEKHHPGLLDTFRDCIGNDLAWYARLRDKLKAERRKAWNAIPGAESDDTLETLLGQTA